MPVAFGLLITTGSPAAADCSGPTIEIEQREVVRGAQLVVTGYAWGDNCYDTGAPPDGEGVLGVPIGGIDVYVVQGTEEFLVATGAADDEYSFDVTIVIPAELTAGTAIVQARWAANRIAYSENPQIVVTDASPLVSDEPTVATFEPATTTTTTTTADSTTTSTVAPTSAPPKSYTADVEVCTEMRSRTRYNQNGNVGWGTTTSGWGSVVYSQGPSGTTWYGGVGSSVTRGYQNPFYYYG